MCYFSPSLFTSRNMLWFCFWVCKFLKGFSFPFSPLLHPGPGLCNFHGLYEYSRLFKPFSTLSSEGFFCRWKWNLVLTLWTLLKLLLVPLQWGLNSLKCSQGSAQFGFCPCLCPALSLATLPFTLSFREHRQTTQAPPLPGERCGHHLPHLYSPTYPLSLRFILEEIVSEPEHPTECYFSHIILITLKSIYWFNICAPTRRRSLRAKTTSFLYKDAFKELSHPMSYSCC